MATVPPGASPLQSALAKLGQLPAADRANLTKSAFDNIARETSIPANVLIALDEVSGGSGDAKRARENALRLAELTKGGGRIEDALATFAGDPARAQAIMSRSYDIADALYPAAESAPKPQSKGGGLGTAIADVGKTLAGGAVQAAGSGIRALGVAGDEALKGAIEMFGSRADGADRAEPVTGETIARTAGRAAGDAVKGAGEAIAATASDDFREAMQNSQPSGELFKPSTWSLGEDPSFKGVVGNVAQGLGSMVPVVAAGALTGGAGAAAVGGAMAGGEGAEEGRQFVLDAATTMGEDGQPLIAAMPEYQTLRRDEGLSHEQAAMRLAREAETNAGFRQAIVGALGGAATNKIMSPAAGFLGTGGRAAQIAKRGSAGFLEEGAQEALEGAAAKSGIADATGADVNLAEDSFGNFLLGGMTGGAMGAAGGALFGGRERPAEAEPEGDADQLLLPPPSPEEMGMGMGSGAPLALPAPEDGGTIFGSGRPGTAPGEFERNPDTGPRPGPGDFSQQPAGFRPGQNTPADGSGGGAVVAPAGEGVSLSAPAGAAATNTVPKGPIESIAQTIAPAPMPAAAPPVRFPEYKAGAAIKLGDPETGEVFDAVFLGETQNGARVRIAGNEVEVTPEELDMGRDSAARIAAEAKAAAKAKPGKKKKKGAAPAPMGAMPGSSPLAQEAVSQTRPTQAEAATDVPDTDEGKAAKLRARLDFLAGQARNTGWNARLTQERDAAQRELSEVEGRLKPAESNVDAYRRVFAEYEEAGREESALYDDLMKAQDTGQPVKPIADGINALKKKREAMRQEVDTRLAALTKAERKELAGPREPSLVDAIRVPPSQGVQDDVEPASAAKLPETVAQAPAQLELDERANGGTGVAAGGPDLDSGAQGVPGLAQGDARRGQDKQPSGSGDLGGVVLATGAGEQSAALTPTIEPIRAKAAVLRGVPEDQAPDVPGVSLKWDAKEQGFIFSRKHIDKVQAVVAPAAHGAGQQTPASEEAAPVAAAAIEANPEPTEAQKEAGNYRKGHVSWNGLELSIENAKGSTRSGKDSKGNEWSVTMPAHYGYFKGTKGADGDHVDFHMGDVESSDYVLIVDQVKADTGAFDEHKVIIGTTARGAALGIYRDGFADGRGDARIGGFTETTVDGLKAILENGDLSKPIKPLDYPFKGRAKKTEREDPKGAISQPDDPRIAAARESNDRHSAEQRASDPFKAALTPAANRPLDLAALKSADFDAWDNKTREDGQGSPAKRLGRDETGRWARAVVKALKEQGWSSTTDAKGKAHKDVDFGYGMAHEFDETKVHLTAPNGLQLYLKIGNSWNKGGTFTLLVQFTGEPPKPNHSRPFIGGNEYLSETMSPAEAAAKLHDMAEQRTPRETPKADPTPEPAAKAPAPEAQQDRAPITETTKAENDAAPADLAQERGEWDQIASRSRDTLARIEAKERLTERLTDQINRAKKKKDEAALRRLRQRVFEAEEAMSQAVDSVSFAPFAPFAEDFPIAAADLRSHIGREATKASVQDAEAAKAAAPAPAAPAPAATAPAKGLAANLSPEKQARLALLQKQLADKIRSQTSSGLDPAYITIGAEIVALYVEGGARQFGAMLRDFAAATGLSIREAQPAMRAAYAHVRDEMELNGEDTTGFDDHQTVMAEVRKAMAEEEAAASAGQGTTPEPAQASEPALKSEDKLQDKPADAYRDRFDNFPAVLEMVRERSGAALNPAVTLGGAIRAGMLNRSGGSAQRYAEQILDRIREFPTLDALLTHARAIEAERSLPDVELTLRELFRQPQPTESNWNSYAAAPGRGFAEALAAIYPAPAPAAEPARAPAAEPAPAPVAEPEPAPAAEPARAPADTPEVSARDLDEARERTYPLSEVKGGTVKGIIKFGGTDRFMDAGEYVGHGKFFMRRNTVPELDRAVMDQKPTLTSAQNGEMAQKIVTQSAAGAEEVNWLFGESDSKGKPAAVVGRVSPRTIRGRKVELIGVNPVVFDFVRRQGFSLAASADGATFVVRDGMGAPVGAAASIIFPDQKAQEKRAAAFDMLQSEEKDATLFGQPAAERTDDNRDHASNGVPSAQEGAQDTGSRQGQAGSLRQDDREPGGSGDRRAERPGERSGAGRDGSGTGDGTGAGNRAGGRAGTGAANHIIEPGGLDLARGEKTRARESIAAIRTLRTLQAEGRPATAEERATLAKYGGAGTLAGTLPRSDGTIKFPDLAAEIESMTTPEERATLSRTSQYAFYTAESALRSMWNLAEQLGFKGGRVYEPGMGVGGFAGTMPQSLDGTYTGLELDHLTAQIAGALYPKHRIKNGDFIKEKLPQGFYDLVIGNPPFAGTKIQADPDYPQGFMIHDYFFAKSLDAVRPGGLLMFITSAGTMNKMDSGARDYLADRADLVGAIRLPNTAFKENGTEVTTDIIVLRKRLEGEAEANPGWRTSEVIDLPRDDGTTGQAAVNGYFVANPDMILGEQGLYDTLTAGERVGVRPKPDSDLRKDLQAVLSKFPTNIMSEPPASVVLDALDADHAETKPGSFYLKDGELYQFDGNTGRKVEARSRENTKGMPKAAMEAIKALIPIKNALRDVYAADVDGKDASKARKALNEAYDAYVKERGPIGLQNRREQRPSIVEQESARQQAHNDARASGQAFDIGSFDAGPMIEAGASMGEIARARQAAREAGDYREGDFDPAEMPDKTIVTRPNIDPFMDDPESYRLLAIEKYNEKTDTGEKTRVFTENAVRLTSKPQINSPEDALLHLLGETGKVQPERIAALAGSTAERVIKELEGKIFLNPVSREWETKARYLSGNVVAKLEAAEREARTNPEYEANVDALRAVQPAPITSNEIAVPLGAHWFPTSVYSDFARSLGLDLTAEFKPRLGIWLVSGSTTGSAATSEWGTPDRPFAELMQLVMTNKPIEVKRSRKNSDGSTETWVDQEATQAATDKARELQDRFKQWFWEDEARTAEMEAIYNRTFNAEVAPQYDGSYLTTPGIHSDWSWRPHQTAVIARILQSGDTYMAHTVGAGKTSAMIGAGMEAKRLGLAKKPWYVVPNHMLIQFTTEFYQQYPLAKILVADDRRFHTSKRKQFVADAALGDYDAVIITHSAFHLIPPSEASKKMTVEGMLQDVRDVLEGLEGGAFGEDAGMERSVLGALNSMAATLGVDVKGITEGKTKTRKKIEALLEAAEQRISRQTSDEGKDAVFNFDETGADMLFVDEAHLFRKLSFATSLGNIKGIDPQGSQASMDLFIKTRGLAQRNPGRSLVLASGTPITNTMAELYSISRYLQPQALEDRNISAFDSWAATFGQTESALEQDPAGGYKTVTRFSKFVNTPELSLMVRQVMDVVSGPDLEKYVTRPALKGGKRNLVVVEPSPDLKAYQQTLAERMKAIENRKGPVKKGDDILLSVINDGRLAAIDLRLVDPAAGDTGSKLDQMVQAIYRRWKDGAKAPLYGVRKEGGYTDQPVEHGPTTQIVFSTLGVNPTKHNPTFSVHRYIKAQLVSMGVPADEIILSENLTSDARKQRAFMDMNEGKKRILIGSKTLFTGVNAQRRITAIHNLDPLWFPADDEQRNGRGIRQGNMNREIEILDYSAKGTYDATMWQMMGRKAGFIEGFFRGDPTMRDMDDLGEASQYEQAKAMSTADPRVLQLTELRAERDKLARRAGAAIGQRKRMEATVRGLNRSIDIEREELAFWEGQSAKVQDTSGDRFEARAGGKTYTERKEFGADLISAAEDALAGDGFKSGDRAAMISGFPVHIGVWQASGTAGYYIPLPGDRDVHIGWSDDPVGMARKVEGALSTIKGAPTRIAQTISRKEAELADTEAGLAKLKDFAEQDKLDALQDQVDALESELLADTAAANAAAEAEGEEKQNRMGGIAATPANLRAVAASVAAELKAHGLGDAVKVRTVRGLLSASGMPVQGTYRAGEIGVNADAVNPLHTARHEIVHALRDANLWGRDYGLFTQEEWRALVKAARANKGIRQAVEAAYPDLSGNAQTEEMVAELYADWAAARSESPPGALGAALERIRSLFRAMASALRGEGFIDAARVMERMANGEIGGRGPEGGPGGRGTAATKDHRAEDPAEGGTFAAELMTDLAAHDELFAYPRSKAGSLKGTLADIAPEVKFVGDATRPEEGDESGAERRYLLRTPNGNPIYVYETDDSVWLDVSWMKEGERGSAVYMAVGDYAHNAGLSFIGDPAGLSDVALRRRTDAMLSSALRHGTTNHLKPHPRQLEGDASLGVPPLRWTEGDYFANVAAMIEASTASLAHHVPEITRARYDFASRTFLTGKGQPLSDGMLDAWYEHPRIRAASAGRNSLKRAVILNTLLRAESGARPGLLEQALRWQSESVRAGGLSGVLYQRDLTVLKARLSKSKGKALGMIGNLHWKKAPALASSLLTDAMGKNDRFNALGLVPGRALFDELGKNLPAAQEYLGLKEKMDAARNKWQARSASMVDKWTKAASRDPEGNQALMEMMHESTLAQLDPSKPDGWQRMEDTEADRVNAKSPKDRRDWAEKVRADRARRQKDHAELVDRFNRLPKPMRELYSEIRDEYSALADEMDLALVENIRTMSRIIVRKANREHKKELARIRDEGLTGNERMEALGKANERLAAAHARAARGEGSRVKQLRQIFEGQRMQGPYFPLTRFGNYFVTIRDEDGKVTSFSRFETEREQAEWIAQAKKDGLGKVESGVLSGDQVTREQVAPGFLADVEEMLQEAGADKSLMDQVWQRFLETLPDQSMRTSSIHRKGRKGFNKDAVRAFASSMFHGAHQAARLRYGAEMEEMLEEATEQAKVRPDANRAGFIVREMKQRHAFTMQPTNNPLVTKITGLAFVWYLGMSPAAAAVNLSQTTVVGVPLMASRYKKAGVPGVGKALAAASRDFMRGKGKVTKRVNGLPVWGEAWSIENAPNLTADERKAMEQGYERGVIDKTQAHDLASVADSGVEYNPVREKIMRVIGFMFHHAERFNREVTYLAAYRLARGEGMSHEAAISSAAGMTWKVHFDYSNTSKPRAMTGDAAKVFLIFRNFQINMIFRLFRDTHQALVGGTKEERREARAQLIGVTLSMMAHAGIRGVWGYGLLMLLLSVFFPGDGDDMDEWLQDALLIEGDSPGVAAWNWIMGLALNGVPGHALGVSLTERIGMPDLILRSPDKDMEGKDLWAHYTEQLLGPAFGIGGSIFTGAAQVMDGQMLRGGEKMVPTFLRNAVKTIRYGTEGVTTYRGDELIDGLNPWQMLMQLQGFTPAEVAERYEVNSRLKKHEQRITDERRGIMRAIGDAAKVGEAIPERQIEKMRDFNARYPEWAITADSIRKSMQSRERAKQRNEFGVSVNPKINDRLREERAPTIYG